MRKIDDLINFGPYMIKIMHKIGIYSEDDLLQTTYAAIEAKLLSAGIKPHLMIFYSIEMGLQNRPWNDITATEKQEIKLQLNKRP